MTRAEAYRLLIADVYELAGASRSSSGAIAAKSGQTVARWHVLSVLLEPHTVAAAARRLGLTRQSVHRVVDGLVEDGLVIGIDNPDHRSAPLMTLTSAGKTVLDDMVDDGDATRVTMLDQVGTTIEQMDFARTVLRELLNALG